MSFENVYETPKPSPPAKRRLSSTCRPLYQDLPAFSERRMRPKPWYGRSAFVLMPGLAWIVPGWSWLMFRSRCWWVPIVPT